MAQQKCVLLVIAIICLLLAACGGSNGSLVSPMNEDGTEPPEIQGESADLPDMSNMPAPRRETSVTGPGWYPLNVKQTLVRKGGQPSLPGQIVLEAIGDTAFAVYGARGFDNDMMPTSVRLTLADVTGNYYIAFSNYFTNRWQMTGPWNGAATVEIPNLAADSAADIYISRRGWHYFAIIIPDGGAMTVSGVELGVHGGQDSLRPPLNLGGAGGENGFYLMWIHSVDYISPDFAGYLLQRAPLLHGDFDNLNPGLIDTNTWFDETAVLDTSYRYRIATVDTNGNRSSWVTYTGGPATGGEAMPVVVVDLPRSHFYGPVEVTFDLSESYDPEGAAVDLYGITINNSPINLSGTNPVFAVTLQPGTYHAACLIQAGGRLGSTVVPLVVYPQWQDDPVVVHEPDLCGWESRLGFARGTRHPVSGRMVFAGLDKTMPGLAIWYENEAGTDYEPFLLPAYTDPVAGTPGIRYIGEPVVVADTVYFPMCNSNAFMVASFDGEHAQLTMVASCQDSPAVAAATDGDDHLWLFYEVNSVPPKLVAAGLGGMAPVDIVTDLHDGLVSVDAVYNPGSEMVDIAYRYWDGLIDLVKWVEWDPATGTTGASANLGGGESGGQVDIEIDSLTNLPAVLYFQDSGANMYQLYTEYEGGGIWSAAVAVDDSEWNRWEADLVVHAGRPYAYFSLLGGAASLYERDAGTWSVRNVGSVPGDHGYYPVLFEDPLNDDFVILEGDNLGDFYIDDLYSDGTGGLRAWTLWATEGQGFEMHGTSSPGGMHVVWHSWTNFVGRHLTSTDGETWVLQANLPGSADALDIAANGLGDVYLSTVNNFTGTANLYIWDGLAWAPRGSYPNCDPMNRPWLAAKPLSNNIYWMVDEDAPPHTMHYSSGNETDGYLTSNAVLLDYPVWSGAMLSGIGLVSQHHIVFAGGASADQGSLGYFGPNGGELDLLSAAISGYPRPGRAAIETWGRTLGTALFMGESGLSFHDACWVSHGDFLKPVRYELTTPLIGENKTTILDMEQNFLLKDGRRTVSTESGWGFSAVALISNLGGTDVIFEWSNFGDWEELELPGGMDYMTMPELIIGSDGRWHILYKNYKTDQMMCRSTL